MAIDTNDGVSVEGFESTAEGNLDIGGPHLKIPVSFSKLNAVVGVLGTDAALAVLKKSFGDGCELRAGGSKISAVIDQYAFSYELNQHLFALQYMMPRLISSRSLIDNGECALDVWRKNRGECLN